MKKFWIIEMFFYILFPAISIGGDHFIDNHDGTIFDQVTELKWQKEGDDTPKTWNEAYVYCESKTLAGRSSWRLPTLLELRSLIDDAKLFPAINTKYFPETKSEYYWSSTLHPSSSNFALDVNFSSGYANSHIKSDTLYVRCVNKE